MADWSDFLKLVDPARLAQPPGTDLAALEQQTSARFEAAYQQYLVETTHREAALHRPVWQPPAPVQQYLDLVACMQQWVACCAAFEATAEQLRAAGRPAFAARLTAVKDDTERAAAICRERASAAGAHQADLMKIGADMNAAATEAVQTLNASMKKAFDAMNKARGR